MASSNKRLRATSEILDCLDNCPSESDFTGIDDSDLDDDVLSNEVRMDMGKTHRPNLILSTWSVTWMREFTILQICKTVKKIKHSATMIMTTTTKMNGKTKTKMYIN